MNDPKQLEVLTHDEAGFKPLVDFGAWRAAFLNEAPMYERQNIAYFDKHLETDEVFVLLSGRCQLLLAGRGDKPENTQSVWLEPLTMYNVKLGTWHTHVLTDGAKVAVFENFGTSVANSPRYFFAECERENLIPKE